MTRAVLIVAGVLAACSVPDVQPNVTAAAELLAVTEGTVRPGLEPLAAAELAEAEDAAMRDGRVIVGLDGTCHYDEAREAGEVTTDCSLIAFARPDDGAVNATTTLDALDVMAAYFTALGALASAESSDEVRARTAALMKALGDLGEGNDSAALDRIAAGAKDRAELVTRTAGFLAAQARIAALRRVVRKADPVIARIVAPAAAFLDQQPGNLPDAQDRLDQAEAGYIAAAGSGNVAEHRAAAADLRDAFAAFKRAEAASPANRLLLLRRFHAELLDRLTSGGEPEDLLSVAEEIKAIVDLANQGE